MKAKNTKTPPVTKRPRRGSPTEPGSGMVASSAAEKAQAQHVAKLVKLGVVKPGEPGPIPEELFRPGPPAPSALKALRESRGR